MLLENDLEKIIQTIEISLSTSINLLESSKKVLHDFYNIMSEGKKNAKQQYHSELEKEINEYTKALLLLSYIKNNMGLTEKEFIFLNNLNYVNGFIATYIENIKVFSGSQYSCDSH